MAAVLDMNYVALHEGKKSVSEIRTDGVLHENAKKAVPRNHRL